MDKTRHKVLFIDDDRIAQIAFKRLVRNEDLSYDYVVAGSIAEARNALATDAEFDVAVIDYMLGDGTAFDLLELLGDIPAILATGSGNEEVAVQAMKAGAYDYLIKDPSHGYLKVLPEIIKKVINQKRAEEELEGYHENLEELVKQRAEQLAAERELLSVTFSSMTDGVIVVDTDRRIILLNSVAERLTGTVFENVRGSPVDDVLSLVDEQLKEPVEIPIDKVLSSGNIEAGAGRSMLIRANGQEYPISIAAAPICKQPGTLTGVVMLMHDLSQEREVDRIKTDFVSSVSHELRTPLTSIKAYTATILRDPNMAEQTKHEFLTAVDEESDRLTDLVNELLEISRLESGSVEAVRRTVDIGAVVRQSLSGFQRSANAGNIQLDLDIDDAVPQLLGDETRIRSMVSNLVNNAIKFTPQGGKVRVSVQRQDEHLAISVSDTGIGIPSEEIPRIFERFYRVPQPDRQVPGTGLGLAIVKEIAAIYGGTVQVESELGRGTTFTVLLPTADGLVLQAAGAENHAVTPLNGRRSRSQEDV